MKLGIQHRGSGPTKFALQRWSSVDHDLFMAWSNLLRNTLVLEKKKRKDFKVQMTKIFISVSSLQLQQHYFKDHTAENRMQKFQLVAEI